MDIVILIFMFLITFTYAGVLYIVCKQDYDLRDEEKREHAKEECAARQRMIRTRGF